MILRNRTGGQNAAAKTLVFWLRGSADGRARRNKGGTGSTGSFRLTKQFYHRKGAKEAGQVLFIVGFSGKPPKSEPPTH
jgi:hypothetical protein